MVLNLIGTIAIKTERSIRKRNHKIKAKMLIMIILITVILLIIVMIIMVHPKDTQVKQILNMPILHKEDLNNYFFY